MARQRTGQLSLTLSLDHTDESRIVRDAVEQLGKTFRVVYASRAVATVLAIETPFGTIRGFAEICRYLLPKDFDTQSP